MADADKLAAVRAALPSLAAGIQLNAAVAGPLPVEVAAAMEQIVTYERDVGRADPGHLDEAAQRVDEALAAIAAVIGGDLDEVQLSHGPTEAVQRIVGAIDWRPGDRLVVTSEELGGVDAWRARLGGRGSAELGVVRLPIDASDDDIVAAFDGAVGPAARLVALPHVLATTGRVLPLARVARLARDRGAVVLVDGSQAAGAIPVSVADLGADAYVVAGSTWLLGPEGIGGLWLSTALRSAVPAASGWHGPSVVGLARAIGWLSMFVGLDFVHRRGLAVARRAAEHLAAIDGVTVLTPIDRMATIVALRIAGWGAGPAVAELAARTFAIATALPELDAIRISPGFWTTDDEVDRFVAGVALLADHAPGELPPRRTLAMLG